MSDQIESATALMVRDYLVLAFLVSLGSLQIAVSISNIRGLCLLPNRSLTRALGIALIILGIGIYVLSPLWIEGPWGAGSVTDGTSVSRVWGTAEISEISAARNMNDIHGGMAGTAYAGFFILSAVLATIFSAIIGTLHLRISGRANPHSFKKRLRESDDNRPDGLDALKHSDPLSTLTTSLHNLRRTGLSDARDHLRSAHRWSIPSLIERVWRN